MATDEEAQQRLMCEKYGAVFVPCPPDLKVGISSNAFDPQVMPINGQRLPSDPGTTGWFVYAGEEGSTDPDFFKPLHVAHLSEYPIGPFILRFLGLPPGWCFQVDNAGYEDVWFDPGLLDVD